MASFEIVDSGRFSGGRSNFSQTCNLLSQYLKNKGSFGDLSLGLMTPKVEPKETMDLLPMIEKSGQNSGAGNLNMQLNNLPQLTSGVDVNLSKSETETAPMTIFYGGQVMVFNDFPANKAKEIMMLASKTSAAVAPPPPAAAHSPAESTTSTPKIVSALGSDLPIARKNSLARFLEKRKDRITANAPYPASKPAARTDAWLGISSHQVQRH